MPLLKRNVILLSGVIASLALIAAVGAQQPANLRVDAKVLKNAGTPSDPLAGSWLSYGRTLGETRDSPLKQITTANVNRLGLSWTYVLGAASTLRPRSSA